MDFMWYSQLRVSIVANKLRGYVPPKWISNGSFKESFGILKSKMATIRLNKSQEFFLSVVKVQYKKYKT